MKGRLCAATLCLVLAGKAWSLDADARRTADRYHSILVSDPLQQTVFDRLWKIYADAGETAVLVESARSQAAESPVLSARILQRAGETAAMESVLKDAVSKGDVPAAEMLSAWLAEKGDFSTAITVLEKAAGRKPALLVKLGELYLRTGNKEKSRAAWEQAAAQAPNDLGLRKKLSAACLEAGNVKDGVAHLRVIAEHGSPTERFEAWEEISRSEEQAGHFGEAVAAQEALLALMGPGHWRLAATQQRLLALHERAGTLETLEKQWSAEAAARPRDPEPALRMAQLEKFTGDDEKQLFWLHKASEAKPGDVNLLRHAAALELSRGNAGGAEALYDKALALRPQDEDLIFLRAEVAALRHDETGAEKRIAEFVSSRGRDEKAANRALEFYRKFRLSGPLERALQQRFSADLRSETEAAGLARFYLDEHRYADARHALERFDSSHLSARDAADVAFRFSEILREAKMPDEAIAWGRKAFERDRTNGEYALHLTDLLTAAGKTADARRILEEAYAASAPALPREDVDRRLFLEIQAAEKESPDALPGMARAVREYVERLQKQAAAGKEDTAWMRLARWRRWSEGAPQAAAALREGLKYKDSAVLREALALALADSGQTAAAITEWQSLAKLQPDRALEFRRRIGHLQLDSAQVEDGLATFAAISADQPNDWQSTADLALAEQMAGNWFRAMETWQHAYRQAPAPRRGELLPPILSSASRLQLYDPALDFLEDVCAAQTNTGERGQVLKEAARWAKQNNVVENWRARLERRIETAPRGMFWKAGLASLLEEDGRAEEARMVLRDAQQEAGTSGEDIRILLAAAEASANWSEAARALKQLSSAENSDPALFTQRAEFLERAGQTAEAEQAWNAIVVRFGRDPGVLTNVAEFFERTGKEAEMEKCYRAAARLGGCAPQVLLRLGRLALERGDRMQALADFEEVLKTTRADAGSAKDCFPLPARILASKDDAAPAVSFLPGGDRTSVKASVPWQRPDEETTEGCRLLAIKEAAQLLAGSPEKAKWLAQFPDSLERAWADFYSGESAAALRGLEQMMDGKKSAGGRAQSYAALAMESSRADVLAKWAVGDGEGEERWDDVLAALARMLGAGWMPQDDFVTRLFESAPALKRWQAARAFSSRNQCRTARLLGRDVPAALKPSLAASAWVELSKWDLALRDSAGTIACLDEAIGCAPPSVSFATPLFAAIRSRWLLTLPENRATFEEKLMGRLNAKGHLGCVAAGEALVAALKGNNGEAAAKIDDVFAGLGVTEQEGWAEIVQRGGIQLEEWNLRRLARDLYRNDLARDSVIQAMRGESFRQATEAMLILNKLADADDDGAARYLVNEWLAYGAPDEVLLQATVRLCRTGRAETAAAVYRALRNRSPMKENIVAGMMTLATVPKLRQDTGAFLETFLSVKQPSPASPLGNSAAMRLATLKEEDGDLEKALAALDRAGADERLDKALLLQRVQLLCRMGRFREALEKLAAHALVFSPASQGIGLRMAELYTGFGREKEARAVLEKTGIPAGSAVPAGLPEAGSSPAKTQRAMAGVTDATKPEAQFHSGRKFLMEHADLPADQRARELQRLQKIAARNPSLLPEFYIMRKELAATPEAKRALEKELSGEWNAGRGSYLAGEILIQLYLEQQRFDVLEPLLKDYLTDSNYNEQAWDQIGQRLLAAGQPTMAVRVFSTLMAKAPGDANRALRLATALWKSGRQPVAREIIPPIARIAAVEPQWHLDLAEFYLRVGNPMTAAGHLKSAEPFLPGDARLFKIWTDVAGELIMEKKLDEAKSTLVRISQNFQSLPAKIVADFYDASGALAGMQPDSNEFDLSPRDLRDLQVEVIARLASRGDHQAVWAWMGGDPSLLRDARCRDAARALEEMDWSRAAKLWEVASQDPLWDVRVEAAQFYLRHSQKFPASALKDLARAHELHPGSFSIARAYALELLRVEKPAMARRALQDVIEAYATPAARRAAREMLASLQASPVLPSSS